MVLSEEFEIPFNGGEGEVGFSCHKGIEVK